MKKATKEVSYDTLNRRFHAWVVKNTEEVMDKLCNGKQVTAMDFLTEKETIKAD